ncbi:MAG: hypothetical protein PHX61_04500 [Alphaproteobacteria bacterium]|nr:hypothetical protein [Alphaproteobacteria bacterium]
MLKSTASQSEHRKDIRIESTENAMSAVNMIYISPTKYSTIYIENNVIIQGQMPIVGSSPLP